MKNIPILLTIFNRPITTREVIRALEHVKPVKLYIASDGPRADRPDDLEKILQTRKLATAINWDCEIFTRFRKENLGVDDGMADAITWFFNQVSEGIVLEDDCVPHPSFFHFCADLLDYYRDEPRVMHISGNNFQYGRKRGPYSYYFSKYSHNWGWASWRRAWKLFNYNIGTKKEKATTWDYQWQLFVEKQGGLAVLPNVNLVSNIGFGENATHTKENARYSNLGTEEIGFPLKHPQEIQVNKSADNFTYYSHFNNVANINYIWIYQLVISFCELNHAYISSL